MIVNRFGTSFTLFFCVVFSIQHKQIFVLFWLSYVKRVYKANYQKSLWDFYRLTFSKYSFAKDFYFFILLLKFNFSIQKLFAQSRIKNLL